MTNVPLRFQQWLAHAENCHSEQIQMGLERVTLVAQRANVIDFQIPVVTVAGTNGKGTTVAVLSKLLQTSGLKVGTYTSPHLLDFKERIQVNDQFICEDDYCMAFEAIEQARLQTPLTFFEYTTLVALWLFKHRGYQLDIVILEVGLGGRLDAVNIINPHLAIVTALGLDHQAYLGDTLESIAKEKAGIFRHSQKAIIAKRACVKTLLEEARALDMTLYIEGEHFEAMTNPFQWKMSGSANIKVEHYLASTSVSLALAAYTILDGDLFSLEPLEQAVQCIKEKVMVGRCYPVVFNNRQILFDVAHNPQGTQWLASQLASLSGSPRVYAVWASMEDKDLLGIIEPMKDVVDAWFIGQLENNARCASLLMLKDALIKNSIENINSFNCIVSAFDKAVKQATDNDVIVVFGSFYTVAQVMQDCLAHKQIGIQKISHHWTSNFKANTFMTSEH